jgi:probable HAF family extracellular repeat protein
MPPLRGFTRAALSASGGAKSDFLSVSYQSNSYQHMRTLTTILLLAHAVLVARLASAQARYSVTDLAPLTAPDWTADNQNANIGINNNGQVAAYGPSASGRTHAFIYSGGTLTDLSALSPTVASLGYAINSSGQVAGFAGTGAALFSDGTTTSISSLLNAYFSYAYGISDNGLVVGYAGTKPNNYHHAFLYSAGTVTDLGTFPEGSLSHAYGVNTNGQVVGYADTASGTHAFVYSNGVMSDLGTMTGSGFSEAIAINNKGQIAGYSSAPPGGATKAFLYSNGVMQNLGAPPGAWATRAMAINNNGQIVGVSYTTNATNRAFLFNDGVIVDLNTLLPSGSGWTLLVAEGINDSGQIVGCGISPLGKTNAFLLTPLALPNPRPLLRITPSAGRLVLSWPESAAGFALYQTPTLVEAGWGAVTNTPNVVDGQKQVVLSPALVGSQFFRLQTAGGPQ